MVAGEVIPALTPLGRRVGRLGGTRERPRAGTISGMIEAINGRLEHLRDFGWRNLTDYIARSPWKSADSDPSYAVNCDEPENCERPRSLNFTAGFKSTVQVVTNCMISSNEWTRKIRAPSNS